jgi:hypothetical protein
VECEEEEEEEEEELVFTNILCIGFFRGWFAKFMDSPYYSESGRGDGIFFEVFPLASDALLQFSAHFSKTCCRPLITSLFLASELPFHGSKSPEIAWREISFKFFVLL